MLWAAALSLVHAYVGIRSLSKQTFAMVFPGDTPAKARVFHGPSGTDLCTVSQEKVTHPQQTQFSYEASRPLPYGVTTLIDPSVRPVNFLSDPVRPVNFPSDHASDYGQTDTTMEE